MSTNPHQYEEWHRRRIKTIIDHYGHTAFHNKTILDLGSYDGEIAAAFARLGANVVCVEARQENINEIQKKHKYLNVIRADLDNEWPFSGQKFDFAFSLGLLCHLKNYEKHIKDICGVSENIILETEVLDTTDVNAKVSIYEDKLVKDLSFNGEGSVITATNIQNKLSEIGATYKRINDKKINSGLYIYDWAESNSGRVFGKRRFWFIRSDKYVAQMLANRENIQKLETQYNVQPILIRSNMSPPIHPVSRAHREMLAKNKIQQRIPTPTPTPTNQTSNNINNDNIFISKVLDTNTILTNQKIRLFYNHYEDKFSERKKEIDFCFDKNKNNSLFEMVVFNEQNPTYNFFFNKINEITGPDDINIICNSDIFFDKTILLSKYIKHKELYALTCWEWHNDNSVIFKDRSDSQDTWIVRGKIENVIGDFPIDSPFGENRIAYDFHKAGYKLINPSKSIKTYHLDAGFGERLSKKIDGPHVFIIPTEIPSSITLPTIRLFYNYYEDKHPERKKEIDFCFEKNKNNPLLDVVVLRSDAAPTYDFFFNRINEITGPNDINIICNSDIFFDETILLVKNMGPKDVYALSRWDWKSDTSITHRAISNSQDTWIIRGKAENINGNFNLGIPFCDNRIAYEFYKAGYKVTNPSKSIKTYHLHNSEVRRYRHNDRVDGQCLFIDVSSL